MSLYLVFARDVGNLGKRKNPRIPQEELIARWNKELCFGEGESMAFLDYFGSTGNYVLNASDNDSLEHVTQVLSFRIPSYDFAVFRYADIMALREPLNSALKEQPASVSGRRWTPGLVLDLNPKGEIPPIPRLNSRFVFGSFAVPRIRTAFKADVLNPNGRTLDKSQRESGWGSLATHMQAGTGGSWTARAMSRVKGLLGVARSYETGRV